MYLVDGAIIPIEKKSYDKIAMRTIVEKSQKQLTHLQYHQEAYLQGFIQQFLELKRCYRHQCLIGRKKL